MIFRRSGSALPSEIRQQLPRGGRGAVWLYCRSQKTWLIAHPEGLSVGDGTPEVRHYPWHQVQQITWDKDADTLSVSWPDPSREVLRLKDPEIEGLQRFGDYARSCLSASQIYTQFAQAPSGVKIRVAVREKPDGTRFSEVVAFGNLCESDQSFVDALESEVRDMAGMCP